MKYDGKIYRIGDRWLEHPVKPSQLKARESIMVVKGTSTLFTVHRPPRKRNESPIQYYKRTGCVDDRYYHKHNGRYYCNPAHCRKIWTKKKIRDEHLNQAYAILA